MGFEIKIAEIIVQLRNKLRLHQNTDEIVNDTAQRGNKTENHAELQKQRKKPVVWIFAPVFFRQKIIREIVGRKIRENEENHPDDAETDWKGNIFGKFRSAEYQAENKQPENHVER